jgi:hypothetical protein
MVSALVDGRTNAGCITTSASRYILEHEENDMMRAFEVIG